MKELLGNCRCCHSEFVVVGGGDDAGDVWMKSGDSDADDGRMNEYPICYWKFQQGRNLSYYCRTGTTGRDQRDKSCCPYFGERLWDWWL